MAGVAQELVSSQITNLMTKAESLLSSAKAAAEGIGGGGYGYVAGAYQETVSALTPYPIEAPAPPNPVSLPSIDPPFGISPPSPPSSPGGSPPDSPGFDKPSIPPKPSYEGASWQNKSIGPMIGYILPQTPVLNIGEFDVIPPAPITITPIQHYFSVDNWIGNEDELVGVIRKRLKNNILYGGTGLVAAVEEAIWNRDLERNERQLSDSVDKLTKEWARKGFTLPDGMLADSISVLQKEYMDKLIDRSREISIKQAELEQTNLFKSMELGINLIATLLGEYYKYEELVLKAQEYTAKYANEYLEMQLKAYTAAVEVFKIRAETYEILIKAQIAKVDIYKAQIEGALAAVTMNEATVKKYIAEIQGETARYTGILEGNKIKAQVYSAEIQGVLAEAQVSEAVVKAYAEEVRGYVALYDAYTAEVKAFEAQVMAERAKMEANAEYCRAMAAIINGMVQKYNADVAYYKAQGDYNVAAAEQFNKVAEAAIDATVEQNKAYVASAKVVSDSLQAMYATEVQKASAIAAAYTTMAGGAMAALHTAAGISYEEKMQGSV